MKSAIYRAVQLPLLIIELKRMAASKRTYVFRFVYAATLFGVACWLFFSASASNASALGRGATLFRQLVNVQFAGLCLVIPATTCGVIAEEKGRETLGVLLLCPLGGFRIVTQKLMSRLVPMFSFVLLSLPLLAVAYSYGGVSDPLLVMGTVILLLTCLQVGALSVLMSVLCRTTVVALMSTYVIILLTFFSCVALWPLYYLPTGPEPVVSLWPVVLCLVFSGVCIFAAALSLVSRVFQSTQNYLLQFQGSVDRFAADANRLVGNIELLQETNNKPKFKPVQWRETDRRSLGRKRYLIRVLILVELPLIFIAALVTQPIGLSHSALRVMLWLGGAILLGTYGASLIAGERSRNTLDVLLTTPLAGRTILIEKSSGLRRLVLVAAVPLMTLPIIEYMRQPGVLNGFEVNIMSFVWSVVAALVWLPAIAWFALWVSTRVPSQTRASLLVLGTLGLVILVPTIVVAVLKTSGASDSVVNLLALFGPAQIQATLSPFAKQYFGLPTIPAWILIVHFAVVASLIFVFRWLALRDIEVTLGRIPVGFVLDESKAPKEALEAAAKS